MRRVGRILLPVSGGSADQEAIELACAVARRHQALLEAIYVIEVKRSLPIDAELQAEIERGETVLDTAERAAEALALPVETSLLQARDIGAAIVDEAVQSQADVIVMGLSYHRKFGEYSIGATASYVLKNAPCLVWIARQAPGPSRA